MEIRTAQQNVQTTFLRGSVGQIVSGLIWLVSAALGTWVSERSAILLLVFVGAFIFPLTQLIRRLLGRSAALPKGHPMNPLAMQVAFILPLRLPLIGAAALSNVNWFCPALMLVLCTHYMPFIFLYGMWEFGLLSTFLIGGSAVVGLLFPNSFAWGGWFTAAALILFAILVQLTPRSAKR